VHGLQAATGSAVLSAADFGSLLENRIDAASASAGVQELKEWMALPSYLDNGLGGFIGPSYASTSNFFQFSSFGVAVQNRNATYPIASIAQLLGTLGNLIAVP
jgi:hypothetical protein